MKKQKRKLMWAFMPLGWIFSSPEECDDTQVRAKLKPVYVTPAKLPKRRCS